MQNASTAIDQLRVIQHGVIWVKFLLFENYMICATIQNVTARSRLLLLPNNFSLKVVQSKVNCKKNFEGTETAWNKFLKPSINATAPVIGMVVSARTKNPKVGQATTNIFKSISRGKILSLTDMHENGLRLKVM